MLIDAHMPEMDGFELAERIRKTPALAGATIMMLSSTDLAGESARCRQLGVTAYLTKPVRGSDLLEAMLVALRRDAPIQTRAALRTPAAEALRSLHVLLAEDNAVNSRLARRLLEIRGHAVTVAANGREAIELCERERFDLVLMDVQMPEMDGFEATAEIRRRESAAAGDGAVSIPIVAMTAHAMQGDEERCLRAGMDAYVSKPIDPERLFEVIAAVTAGGVALAGSADRPPEDPRPERHAV